MRGANTLNKLLIGIVGLVVLVVAAILVVPGFINWNEYKTEIADQAKAFTGRDLVIGGDIRIAILPSPRLVVSDVALANLPGAAAPKMVKLTSLEVAVAFGPLLGGDIQIDSIKLVRPVIELEQLADGRQNWIIAPTGKKPEKPTQDSRGATTQSGAGFAPSVRLDNFVIEDGTVVYRDSKSGTIERVDNINSKIAAASLAGPFESSGQLILRSIPLKYEVTVGKVIHERTVPFGLSFEAAPGGIKGQVNGTLLSLEAEPRFKGKIKVDAKNLASVLVTQGVRGPLPGFLGEPFKVEGDIQGSAAGAEIKNLTLRLGDVQAGASVAVDLRKGNSIVGKLALKHIDLDRWLKMPPVTPKLEPVLGQAAGKNGKAVAVNPQATTQPKLVAAAGFTIPADIGGAFGLTVDAVTFKGGIIRELKADAELSGGAITVSQVSAQFPGSSDIFVSGFLTAAKGEPRFEGQVESTVSDMRSVLRWLGTPLPAGLASDRLRKLTFKSGLVVTRAQAQVAAIDMAFDNSRLTGGLTLAFRDRPAFGADLTVNKVNLDGYMKKSAAPAKSRAKPAAGATAKAASGSALAEGFAAWGVLNTFDANMKLQVKELTFNRTRIRSVFFDSTLYNGTLQIRRASVANLAGVSASLNGNIGGLGGLPSFDKVSISAKSKDLSRLFRMIGTPPPVAPAALKTVSIVGNLDGSILNPSVDLALGAAGAKVDAKGKISLLAISPTADLKVRVRHGNLGRLMAVLSPGYRPSGKLGGLDLSAAAKGGADSLALTGLSGKIGTTTLAGSVRINLAAAKPAVTADIKLGDLKVSNFLPAQRAAYLRGVPGVPHGRSGIIPASWPAPAPIRSPFTAILAAIDGRWSRAPIDLSALGLVNAGIKAKAKSVSYEAYKVDNLDLVVNAKDGVLKTERLTGSLFGGALKVDAEVKSGLAPVIRTNLSVKGLDVGRAARAVTGKEAASGGLDFVANLSTGGKSVAALVSTLAGAGSIALTRVNVKGDTKGMMLGSLFGVVDGLNKLGGALGGRKGSSLADLTGTFKIDKGIIRSDDLKLSSNIGNGSIKGAVDLPSWQIDAAGEISMAKNLLTGLLAQRLRLPDRVPLKVKGRLDAPTVNFDTGRGGGGKAGIPGLDKLISPNKPAGKILNQILPGLLGGPSSSPAPSNQQDSQQEQPPQQQPKPKPQDLIRNILRGLR
jgi:hypothetical protein